MHATTSADALFDTHAHAISDDAGAYPPAATAKNPDAAPFTAEQLLAGMDALDIAHACVVQRYHYYGTDNSYVLDTCAAHPDRLTPVVVLDAEDPGAPAELQRLAAEHRLGGIRLCGPAIDSYDTAWLNSPGAMRLWAASAEAGLPVTLIIFEPHASYNLPAIKYIAERFPETPILIDHLGTLHGFTPDGWRARAQPGYSPVITAPDYGITPALRDVGECQNVRFKFTGINVDCLVADGVDPATFLRRFADEFGVERIVLGSDVGQTRGPYSRLAAGLRDALRLCSPAERERLLRTNAAQLYGSSAAETGVGR